MRAIRALTIATAVAGLSVALPALGAAQSTVGPAGQQFTDAWFWGIKGGGLTLADSGGAYRQAGVVGIDWLITRTHGGLYVSGSKAFFTQQTFILRDPSAPADSGLRIVDLKGLRRLDMALVGFPGTHIVYHPYVGVGFTLEEVSDAEPRGPFSTADQLTYAEDEIQTTRASFTPMLMVGAQWRLRTISVFGQLTGSPTQKNFLLYNGRPFNLSYEMGIRYNVGSSIEEVH